MAATVKFLSDDKLEPEDETILHSSNSLIPKLRTSQTLTFEQQPRPTREVSTSRQIIVEDLAEGTLLEEVGRRSGQLNETASWRNITEVDKKNGSEYYQRMAENDHQHQNSSQDVNPQAGSLAFVWKGGPATSKKKETLQTKIRKLENMLKLKYTGDLSEAVHIQIPGRSQERKQELDNKASADTVPRRKIKVSAGLQKSISSRNLTVKSARKGKASMQLCISDQNTEKKPHRHGKYEATASQHHHQRDRGYDEYAGRSSTPVQLVRQSGSAVKRSQVKGIHTPSYQKYTSKKLDTQDRPRSSSRSISQSKAMSAGKFLRKELIQAQQKIQRFRESLSQRDFTDLQNEVSLMKLVIEIYQRVAASITSKLSRSEKTRHRRTPHPQGS